MDLLIVISNFALVAATLAGIGFTVHDIVRQHSKDIAKVSDNATDVESKLISVIHEEVRAEIKAEAGEHNA